MSAWTHPPSSLYPVQSKTVSGSSSKALQQKMWHGSPKSRTQIAQTSTYKIETYFRGRFAYLAEIFQFRCCQRDVRRELRDNGATGCQSRLRAARALIRF